MRTITVYSWNACSIKNKVLELQNCLHVNKVDIMCVNETKLDHKYKIIFPGYQLFAPIALLLVVGLQY